MPAEFCKKLDASDSVPDRSDARRPATATVLSEAKQAYQDPIQREPVMITMTLTNALVGDGSPAPPSALAQPQGGQGSASQKKKVHFASTALRVSGKGPRGKDGDHHHPPAGK